MRGIVVGLAIVMVPGVSSGQETPREPLDATFTGFYAGPEVGLHDHRLTLEFTDGEIGGTTSRTYNAVGFGGGAFTGYDLAATRRIRLGIEARASVGGGDGPRVEFSNGASYEARPRYGFGASAKAGYVIGDAVLAYATVGYADYRYRQRIGVFIDGASDRVDGFTAGAGVEVRLNRRLGVRLDARRQFDRVDQLLVGVPIRF